MQKILVSTQWLDDNLDNPKLVVLDASMAKVVGIKPIIYQYDSFIPRSRKCDLEGPFCNLSSSMVNAFPTRQQFSQAIQNIGITPEHDVVIYDNQGVYSSPRAWWIFKSMGFEQVYILDGGLPKWMSENRRLTKQIEEVSTLNNTHVDDVNAQLVCHSEYVLQNIKNANVTILDARSEERFLGKTPEPRSGVRSGHIPSALNLPFNQVLADYCFKPITALKEIFKNLSINPEQQLIFSCGSGITACITLVAANIAGYHNTVLYDGSWAEWGSNHQLPIE